MIIQHMIMLIIHIIIFIIHSMTINHILEDLTEQMQPWIISQPQQKALY